MTVTGNLELGCWLVNKAAHGLRLEQALTDFQKLPECAHQLAGTTRGGKQQMVGVARRHDGRADTKVMR